MRDGGVHNKHYIFFHISHGSFDIFAFLTVVGYACHKTKKNEATFTFSLSLVVCVCCVDHGGNFKVTFSISLIAFAQVRH